MKLRTFLQSFIALPIAGCASFVGNSPIEKKHREGLPSTPNTSKTNPAPNSFVIGDIVKWNDWAGYKGKEQLVSLSLITQVWNDDMIMLDDHRGIHSKHLTKVGHCDSITANQGAIIDKIKL